MTRNEPPAYQKLKSNEYNIFPTTATAHKIMDYSWNLITGSNDATCHNASKITTKKMLVG